MIIKGWNPNPTTIKPADSTKSQPWILRGEQSGLLTRTSTTESVSLCTPDEKLTAFLELERATTNK